MDDTFKELDRSVSAASKEYHYRIFGTVGAMDYSAMLEDMRNATPYDVFYLHINTPGGYLDAAVEIIHAIENCQGTVVGVAEGQVASAGSMIFFACHGFVINPMSYFMLHDGSTGVVGKMNENHKAAEFNVRHLKLLYNRVYGKFFSEQEINDVLEGKDIYLLAEEVEKRIQNVLEEEKEDSEVESGEGQITDGAGI